MARSSESKWLDPSLAAVNNYKAEHLTESATTQSLHFNMRQCRGPIPSHRAECWVI